MPDAVASLPPFIPGLLIVGFLVLISFFIGWRNYVGRGSPLPAARLNQAQRGDWRGEVNESESRREGRQEKPKLWEASVVTREKDAQNWEHIVPLSATSLEAQPLLLTEPMSSLTRTTSPSAPTPTTRMSFLPSRPASHISVSPRLLQISVLISMPSSHRPQYQHQQSLPNTYDKSSEDFARPPSHPTSSSTYKQEVPTDAHESGVIPEFALGIVVLPWWREGGDGSGGTMT